MFHFQVWFLEKGPDELRIILKLRPCRLWCRGPSGHLWLVYQSDKFTDGNLSRGIPPFSRWVDTLSDKTTHLKIVQWFQFPPATKSSGSQLGCYVTPLRVVKAQIPLTQSWRPDKKTALYAGLPCMCTFPALGFSDQPEVGRRACSLMLQPLSIWPPHHHSPPRKRHAGQIHLPFVLLFPGDTVQGWAGKDWSMGKFSCLL